MKIRRFLLPLVLLLVAFAMVACGGGEADEPEGAAPASIDVVQNDIYYDDSNDNADNPPVWTVDTGARVAVNLTNNGALEHNWAIVKLGEDIPETYDPDANSDIILEASGLQAAGESGRFSFTAPAPGEYTVICTVIGHYPLMQGRLVVEG